MAAKRLNNLLINNRYLWLRKGYVIYYTSYVAVKGLYNATYQILERLSCISTSGKNKTIINYTHSYH